MLLDEEVGSVGYFCALLKMNSQLPFMYPLRQDFLLKSIEEMLLRHSF